MPEVEFLIPDDHGERLVQLWNRYWNANDKLPPALRTFSSFCRLFLLNENDFCQWHEWHDGFYPCPWPSQTYRSAVLEFLEGPDVYIQLSTDEQAFVTSMSANAETLIPPTLSERKGCLLSIAEMMSNPALTKDQCCLKCGFPYYHHPAVTQSLRTGESEPMLSRADLSASYWQDPSSWSPERLESAKRLIKELHLDPTDTRLQCIAK